MDNQTNKYIAASYKLYVDGDNGKELIEEATAERPFSFITGFGFALDKFEEQMIATPKGTSMLTQSYLCRTRKVIVSMVAYWK